MTSDADRDAAPCGRSASPSRHLFLLTVSGHEYKLSSIWRAAKEVMHCDGWGSRKAVGVLGLAILLYVVRSCSSCITAVDLGRLANKDLS